MPSNSQAHLMTLTLSKPPIVEAILNFECEFPEGFSLELALKDAEVKMEKLYSGKKPVFFQEGLLENKGEAQLSWSVKGGTLGLQFIKEDERQLLQFLKKGFVFNRLSPYGSLDDYINDIWTGWKIYCSVFRPSVISRISLRYINRFTLPTREDGRIELDDYFEIGPKLANEDRFSVVGFLNQYSAIDSQTGYLVNSVLTREPTSETDFIVIFDNAAIAEGPFETNGDLSKVISDLRNLKNHVFERTLTIKCQELFQ